MMGEAVLAAVLLTLPSSPPAEWLECLRPSITMLAIDAEIMDIRETRMVDMLTMLPTLQRRWRDLHDAPLLGEVDRFPGVVHVGESMVMNRNVRAYLVARQAIDVYHAEELAVAICQCDQLYQVFDALKDAQRDYSYISERRGSLRLLRSLIGPVAWASGNLPPSVPVWHLPR